MKKTGVAYSKRAASEFALELPEAPATLQINNRRPPRVLPRRNPKQRKPPHDTPRRLFELRDANGQAYTGTRNPTKASGAAHAVPGKDPTSGVAYYTDVHSRCGPARLRGGRRRRRRRARPRAHARARPVPIPRSVTPVRAVSRGDKTAARASFRRQYHPKCGGK